ncbi:hypothetical protein [Streptomyces sp. NPDC056452]|uniref:hypothetical protein n=1 Tax=Streptomyces sp. NPDC056452 TaxID=3345821 RepID=UPI0036B929C2
MHRTGPTDSSATEAPRTAAEARRAETPPGSTEARRTETSRTAPEPQHDPAPGTAATRTATPGPDPTQVMNRGPGDAGAPPAAPPATARPATARPSSAPAPAGKPAGRSGTAPTGTPLLPVKEQDSLTERMQQAVADFVESPRQAVEEAESTFDRIVADLTEALEERRRTLHTSWQAQDTEARTEELRLALQQYRDVGERLLRV